MENDCRVPLDEGKEGRVGWTQGKYHSQCNFHEQIRSSGNRTRRGASRLKTRIK